MLQDHQFICITRGIKFIPLKFLKNKFRGRLQRTSGKWGGGGGGGGGGGFEISDIPDGGKGGGL